MERQELEQLINKYHSVRRIAAAAQVSYTTVRYWIKRWGLKSEGKLDVLKPQNICRSCGKPAGPRPNIYCSANCQNRHKRKCKFESGERGIRFLKNYLLDLRERKCEACGIIEWMQKPAPLELDHKDGDAANNELENLRLICPNCHAQTENYKGRNKGNGRYSRRERYAQGKSY